MSTIQQKVPVRQGTLLQNSAEVGEPDDSDIAARFFINLFHFMTHGRDGLNDAEPGRFNYGVQAKHVREVFAVP